MSQRDGFTGGFLLGTLVGGVIGGVVGALAASKRWTEDQDDSPNLESNEPSDETIEGARRSLESKISQLNLAIDDVRQQLGSVNGSSSES
jgi:gas vesicle protein